MILLDNHSTLTLSTNSSHKHLP